MRIREPEKVLEDIERLKAKKDRIEGELDAVTATLAKIRELIDPTLKPDPLGRKRATDS